MSKKKPNVGRPKLDATKRETGGNLNIWLDETIHQRFIREWERRGKPPKTWFVQQIIKDFLDRAESDQGNSPPAASD